MGKTHPLVALAVNLLMSQPDEQADSEFPELEEIPCVQQLLKRDGSVTFVLGRTYSGKSVAAYRLAQVFNRPTYAVSPEQHPPSGITELDIRDVKTEPLPYSTLVLDDILGYLSSRDYTQKDVREVEKLIPVSRHRRKLHLIFVAQSSSLADKHVLTADLILLKPPSLLYADTERSSVARYYRDVQPLFEEMSEPQQLKHVFVLSEAWRGMVRVIR